VNEFPADQLLVLGIFVHTTEDNTGVSQAINHCYTAVVQRCRRVVCYLQQNVSCLKE